jgi:putative endonuclease
MPGTGRAGETTVTRGRRAETIAAVYLELGGYRVLARNVRRGPLEIDLIAVRGETIAFVEVRSRSSHTHGTPEESVRRRKQELLTRAARGILEDLALPASVRVRFDLIAIELEPFGLRLRHRLACWPPR